MINIHKRVVKRQITEEEFLLLKNTEPFATFRQDSKAVNFSMIFGGSFKRFSSSTLELKWDKQRINKFIDDNKLIDEKMNMAKKYPNVEPHLWAYYTVAKYIRDNFFKTYKGLMDRIERNKILGMDEGYIRSFHGGIRRFPLLMLSHTDHETLPDENMAEVSNWFNMTSNTSIQNDEICKVAKSIIEYEDTVADDDNYIFGTVHDSVDFVQGKQDIITKLNKIQTIFEKEEDWQKGIKLPIDITIVDLSNPNHYYKHGFSYKELLQELKQHG